MTLAGWAQILVFCAIVAALAKPLGAYMSRVFEGERTFLSPLLNPVERGFYAAAGIDPKAEQRWTSYAAAMLAFNFAGFALLYLILRVQVALPLNPQGMAAMPPDLALNTAISFVTNTNWQNYGGESALGYFAQMAGLTVQNFASAGTGIALAVALIRGFARRSASGIGNFWADLTRCTLYILLPLSLVLAMSWSGRACRKICPPMSTPPRSKAASRPSHKARSPRRSPSRCSAPMAAASSTPMRRILTKIQRPCRISCRWCRSLRSAAR